MNNRIEKYLKSVKRQHHRVLKRHIELDAKYSGNESEYTYYGGFDAGYLVGKISILEDIIDELEEILQHG